MSRKFIAGDGSDSSAAARAYLREHRELSLPDLYVINTSGSLPNVKPGLLGPYHAYLLDESGYFDAATGTLYWIDSAVDVGDVYRHCHFDGVCGFSESFFNTFHSFRVTINILGPDLTLTKVVTDPLPCDYNAQPNGRLIVVPGAGFFIGCGSGYGLDRWFYVPKDGSYSACQGKNVWGRITLAADDGWGTNTEMGGCITAAYSSVLGLVHVDQNNGVWRVSDSDFFSLTPVPLLNFGAGMSAASVTGPDGSIWIVNNGSGGATVTKLDATGSPLGALTNYPIAGSPVGTAYDVEYNSADNTLLFWLGDTLYKWDIATQTVLASASFVFKGSGPIQAGWIPNGLDFINASTLAFGFGIEGYASGLPHYDSAYHFKHWYDAVNARLWLQANDGQVWGVQFAPLVSYLGKTFNLTDYPSSLVWDYKGKFLPGTISRGGVKSKIGFEADTLEVTWSPKDTDVLGDGSVSALAGFAYGLFDNAVVEVWRCVMPRPGDLVGSPARAAKLGDCNTFGAALMFSGRVSDIKVDRTKAVISVISRMETLNVQVPTNLIEPTNAFARNGVGMMPEGGSPLFTVVAGSTTKVIYADPATEANLYDGGFLVFNLGGKLAGVYARVIEQLVVDGHNAFYLEEELPFAPEVGDTLVAYVDIPLDDSGPDGYAGFRWVPTPDNSAVII